MNIYDVAKLSNVSIATVSRVINNKPGVSTAARDRVLKAIEETGFRPNQIAKSLTNNKTNILGIVMPGMNNYYSDRIDAINKVCKQRGYGLMITANYKDSNSTEEDIANFNLLHEKRVDGIIYFPTNVMQEHIDAIKRIRKKMPVVITDKEIRDLRLPCVIQDFVSPTQEIVDYFIQKKHKRIAFIKGSSYDRSNATRHEAYKTALTEAGLTYDEALVAEGAYSVDSGYAAMMEIILRCEVMPTAVFAANDHMAIGAMKALKEKGVRIPMEIEVIGYDDIEFAKYVTPSLSTVRVDQYVMGKLAATMLIDLIEGDLKDHHEMTMGYELIHRESTRKVTS
ncbi:LacI family DNA-binding transcriptional regulator [Petrocella sp. FN5]|uniref:LacI family DNA-binding transcriptional regulator n=1 Tax=Petrocella sp. FN5 TaxID=3032002 RepID=UPI0023DC17FC|nr:LacI family DNA-binding transcriptional regulator [Petrocella sp. FN5]MDF1616492.1 LacI family DNA-binding transcriptional regulator [Petrocella sp. FN5]